MKKHLFSGKSILEILLVLAIIGVLSILTVIGLRLAFDKGKANKIMSDIHLAYISFHPNNIPLAEWIEVKEFSPESGLLTEFYRDIENHDFVRVSDIKKSVCKILLTMTSDKITIYRNNGEILNTCEKDKESLIFSFDASEPLIECDTWQDCASLTEYTESDYPHLCIDNYCTSCPLGYKANSTHERCESKCKNIGTLCTNAQLKQFWCCDSETELCGTQMGPNQCIKSDDKCIYNFYPSNAPDLQYYTDCSCSLYSSTHNVSYYTDCHCDTDGNTITCSQCPEQNFYCAISWTKSTWDSTQTTPSVQSTSAGRLYGKCSILSAYDSDPLTRSVPSQVVCSDCQEDNFYCAVGWTEQSWTSQQQEPVVTNTSTGKLYGKCMPLMVNNAMPLSRNISGGHNKYSVVKRCPEEKYCRLQWQNDECETLTNSSIGLLYGICNKTNSSAQTTCEQ